MIVERVELENVLIHRRSLVNLGKGVIAIVGPNGAGKTSIIDAITYALFGTHGRDPRSKREAIIRLGSHFARITVDFAHRGRVYRVQKMVSKQGRTETRLFEIIDGKMKPLATTTSTVSSELKKILGLDPSIVERLVITRQGQIEDILVNKDKRLELINTILRLKAIEKAHERLSDIIRLVNKSLRYKEDTLRREEERLKQIMKELSELDRIERELAEKKKALEIHEKEYNNLRKEVEELDAKLLELEKRLSELRTLQEEYSRIVQELRDIELKVSELRSAREELKEYERRLPLIERKEQLLSLLMDIEPLRKDIERLETRINRLREIVSEKQRLEPYIKEYENLKSFLEKNRKVVNEYYLIKEEIERIERKISEIRNRIEEEVRNVREKAKLLLPFEPPTSIDELLDAARSLSETLSIQRENLTKEKEKLSSALAVIENRINELKDKLEKLSTAKGVCPLCGRPLSEDERIQLIIRLRRDKEQLEYKKREIYNKYVAVSKQLEKLSDVLSDAESLLREVEVTHRSVSNLFSELNEYERKLREKKSKLLEVYASYKEYQEAEERINELQEYLLRYKSIEREEENLRELEKELRKDREKLEEKISELEHIVEELGLDKLPSAKELSDEIRKFTTRYAELKEKVKMLQMLEERREALIDRVRELETRLQELDPLQRSYVSLIEEVSRKKKELEEKEEELSALKSDVDKLEGYVQALRNKKKEAEELENRVNQLRDKVNSHKNALKSLEKIRRVLGPQGLPRVVREAARQRLEQSLTEMLHEFNIDFDYIKLDEDYNVYLVTRNGEKNIQMLSGGERIALAIAYRLALARIIGEHIEFMIMDEPTVHLDEERRRELISIIRHGLEATGLAQLVVVTHERELEEAADKIIEVQREGGESRVIERLPGSVPQLIEA